MSSLNPQENHVKVEAEVVSICYATKDPRYKETSVDLELLGLTLIKSHHGHLHVATVSSMTSIYFFGGV